MMRLLGVGAASAVAAPALSKAQMAEAVGANPAMAGVVGPMASAPVEWREWKPRAPEAVHEAVHRARWRSGSVMEEPVHIRTKRSWSPAFKQLCAQREHEFWEDVTREIHRNEDIAAKLCRALGIPFDEGAGERQHIPFERARAGDF
jgi:hypothetical protein